MQKAKTRVEIANEYGIHRKTLARWLIKANIVLPGGLVSPKNQKLIYRTFGYPKSLKKESDQEIEEDDD